MSVWMLSVMLLLFQLSVVELGGHDARHFVSTRYCPAVIVPGLGVVAALWPRPRATASASARCAGSASLWPCLRHTPRTARTSR